MLPTGTMAISLWSGYGCYIHYDLHMALVTMKKMCLFHHHVFSTSEFWIPKSSGWYTAERSSLFSRIFSWKTRGMVMTIFENTKWIVISHKKLPIHTSTMKIFWITMIQLFYTNYSVALFKREVGKILLKSVMCDFPCCHPMKIGERFGILFSQHLPKLGWSSICWCAKNRTRNHLFSHEICPCI